MFESRQEGGRVFLSGRLDASRAEEASRILGAISGPVVLDLSELEYISSAGIGILLATYQRLRRAGAEMSLVNLTKRVEAVFRLAGLDQLLPVDRRS